jgi:hypothetical protein
MTALPNIVLVHGAWADGSSWSAVIERLQADGYGVTAPQFPESSLAADIARLRGVLQRQFAARMDATTVEVSTNHVAMVSHPDDVLRLIGTAVEAVSARNLSAHSTSHQGIDTSSSSRS